MQFEKVKTLHESLQGVVHLVKQNEQLYVLKTLNDKVFPKNNQTLHALAEKLPILNHPFIAKFHYISWNEEIQKYQQLMEYYDCGDFFDNYYRFTTKQRLELFLQALYAIDYLHDSGVAHRDLKMENMLIADNFTTLKLADFDYSTIVKPKPHILGTLLYIPPEQFIRNYLEKHNDINTYIEQDIWACGIIIYQIITDTTPWCFEDGRPDKNIEYQYYLKTGKFYYGENMLGPMGKLIKKLLKPHPDDRPCIKEIIPIYKKILDII